VPNIYLNAIYNNDLPLLQQHLRHIGPTLDDETNKQLFEALLQAYYYGEDYVYPLIDAGMRSNTIYKDGLTPFHYLISRYSLSSYSSIYSWLLQTKDAEQALKVSHYGQTPLVRIQSFNDRAYYSMEKTIKAFQPNLYLAAVQEKNLERLKALPKLEEKSIEFLANAQVFQALAVAIETEQQAHAEHLVKSGLRVGKVHEKRMTCLYSAVKQNNLKLVTACLDAADAKEAVNVTCEGGYSPLDLAALHGNAEIMQALYKKGAQFKCSRVEKYLPVSDAPKMLYTNRLIFLMEQDDKAGFESLLKSIIADDHQYFDGFAYRIPEASLAVRYCITDKENQERNMYYLRLLVQHRKTLEERPSEDALPFLHLAAHEKNHAALTELLKAPDARHYVNLPHTGMTVADRALEMKDQAAQQLLAPLGATFLKYSKTSLPTEEKAGLQEKSLLHVYVQKREHGALIQLLKDEEARAKINELSVDGTTAAELAAICPKQNRKDLITLLQNGATLGRISAMLGIAGMEKMRDGKELSGVGALKVKLNEKLDLEVDEIHKEFASLVRDILSKKFSPTVLKYLALLPLFKERLDAHFKAWSKEDPATVHAIYQEALMDKKHPLYVIWNTARPFSQTVHRYMFSPPRLPSFEPRSTHGYLGEAILTHRELGRKIEDKKHSEKEKDPPKFLSTPLPLTSNQFLSTAPLAMLPSSESSALLKTEDGLEMTQQTSPTSESVSPHKTPLQELSKFSAPTPTAPLPDEHDREENRYSLKSNRKVVTI